MDLATFRASFLERAIVDSKSGCWEWTGSRQKTGYGAVSRFEEGVQRTYRAHRMAWRYLSL